MSERTASGSGASPSQVQGILRLAAWMLVFALCVVVIGVPLSGILPPPFALGAGASAGGAAEAEEGGE